MRGLFSLLLLAACTSTLVDDPLPADPTWRSRFYPREWKPADTEDAGRFLHDFSWAGYAHGEREVPTAPPRHLLSAPTGDATALIQAALDDGGVVLLSAGDWRIDGRLLLTASGTVLRGEGPATKLHFTATGGALSQSEHLALGALPGFGPELPLLEDAAARAMTIKTSGGLRAGDDVALGHVITDAFIAEHGMTGTWRAFNGTWQPMAWRTVRDVAADGTVTLDAPLRTALRLRDAASVRRVSGLLREVGVESLSFTNAAPTEAQALQADQLSVVTLYGVVDGWVRDVTSFSPTDGGAHLQSGGIRVVQSNRVTVERCALGRAQHRGPGGNGYLFEVRQSSEVLTADSTATEGRHNFVQNWGFGTTGCVWLRVHSSGGYARGTDTSSYGGVGYSEFHHSLATGNLIDSSTFDDGFSIVNRGLESTGAGHTGTENVIWNVRGGGLLRSMQWGVGYVIGTRDVQVATREVLIGDGTQPWDLVEGVDAGATLAPQSLYEDMLRRRVGR